MPNTQPPTNETLKNQRFRPLDLQFSKLIRAQCSTALTEIEKDVVALCAAITSYEFSLSNVCIPLGKLTSSETAAYYLKSASRTFPSTDTWASILARSGVCGNGKRPTPLINDGERIYIYRNWKMEQEVAASLKKRAAPIKLTPTEIKKARANLDALFEPNTALLLQLIQKAAAHGSERVTQTVIEFFDVKEDEIPTLDIGRITEIAVSAEAITDLEPLNELIPENKRLNWQKVAASIAMTRKLTVISGGPGTGKTTTVSKLLAALCQKTSEQRLEIKLCAPTGKAAARLTESISKAMESLPICETAKAMIPTEASTIHRLLGAIYKKADFRHNAKNKLHLDVLVVDECSMIDLSLMSKLLAALPDDASLILLGDKDQLASVEAGSVMGDICDFIGTGVSTKQQKLVTKLTGHSPPVSKKSTDLSDSLCMLRKSYRFHKASGVGQLAYAVNAGNNQKIWEVIGQDYGDLAMLELSLDSYRAFLSQIASEYSHYLKGLTNGDSPLSVLKEFGRVRLLCATREGECGISKINQKIETLLENRGLIKRSSASAWYVGRPIMISKNDHGLKLYNGDIGICMRDTDNKLYVFFEAPDGGARRFLPSRLPEHETIFAMTIHKSQGSEFGTTFMLLPDKPSPILTRELVYTGITRAKSDLRICCIPEVLNHATSIQTKRNSGLQALLS